MKNIIFFLLVFTYFPLFGQVQWYEIEPAESDTVILMSESGTGEFDTISLKRLPLSSFLNDLSLSGLNYWEKSMSDNLSYMDGNVGVGIADAIWNFQVYERSAAVTLGGHSDQSDQSANLQLMNNVDESLLLTHNGSAATGSAFDILKAGTSTIVSDGDLALGTQLADDLVLGTNNSARLEFTGTGDIKLTDFSGGGDLGLKVDNVGVLGTTPIINGSDYLQISDTAAMLVNYALNSEVVNYWTESGGNIYRSSGNVGIGTASPTELLTITNATHSKIRLESSISSAYHTEVENRYDASNKFNVINNSQYLFGMINTTVGQTTYVHAVNGIGLYAGGGGALPSAETADLLVHHNGNVGIGTMNPSAKLDVVGDVEINGNLEVKQSGAVATTTSIINGTNTWNLMNTGASGDLVIEPQTIDGDVIFRDQLNDEWLVLDNTDKKITIEEDDLIPTSETDMRIAGLQDDGTNRQVVSIGIGDGLFYDSTTDEISSTFVSPNPGVFTDASLIVGSPTNEAYAVFTEIIDLGSNYTIAGDSITVAEEGVYFFAIAFEPEVIGGTTLNRVTLEINNANHLERDYDELAQTITMTGYVNLSAGDRLKLSIQQFPNGGIAEEIEFTIHRVGIVP